MTTNVWWLAARASGLVAWALLTASVVWGLALSTRVFDRRPKAGWLLDLHRYLGGTAVVYTALHLASIVADPYVRFDLEALLVPGASTWRPAAVAWGISSLYLLLAVEATSLLKRLVGRRTWRAVHGGALGLYVLVDIHAFTAGSDARSVWMRWAAIASGAVVLYLVAYKTLTRRRPRTEPPGSLAPRRVPAAAS